MEFVGNSPDLKKALAHPVKPKGGPRHFMGSNEAVLETLEDASSVPAFKTNSAQSPTTLRPADLGRLDVPLDANEPGNDAKVNMAVAARPNVASSVRLIVVAVPRPWSHSLLSL
jgi:hypothetical protein